MAKPGELTEKQKIFCREYILDWNATRAAKAAGYSESTAYSIGSENLTKPEIQSYLTEIQKDLEKIAGISRLRIVQELEKIAFSSIAHLHLTWVTRKEFEELTDNQKAAIQQIETQTKTLFTETGNKFEVEFVKIKLHDKLKAVDTLNKMLGYCEPDKLKVEFPAEQVFKIGGSTITF